MHKRDGEKMLVILLNPDAAQSRALQTVGKIKEELQCSRDETCTCALISGARRATAKLWS